MTAQTSTSFHPSIRYRTSLTRSRCPRCHSRVLRIEQALCLSTLPYDSYDGVGRKDSSPSLTLKVGRNVEIDAVIKNEKSYTTLG